MRELLLRPEVFFVALHQRPVQLWAPAILFVLAHSTGYLAYWLAIRKLSLPQDPAILSGVFGMGLTMNLLGWMLGWVVLSIAVYVASESEARALEWVGYSAWPYLVGGVLLALLALASPISAEGLGSGWTSTDAQQQLVAYRRAVEASSFFKATVVMNAVAALISAWIVQRAARAVVPERAVGVYVVCVSLLLVIALWPLGNQLSK